MPIYAPTQHSAGFYAPEPDWLGTPTTMDPLPRAHSIPADLSLLGLEGHEPLDHHMATPASDFCTPPPVPWTTAADMSPTQYSNPIHHHATHIRAHSIDMTNGVTPVSAWEFTQAETATLAYCAAAPPTLPSNTGYFTSPIPAPSYRPSSVHTTRRPSAGGSCTCFTVCLQSLQALHNASYPAGPACPPLEAVLSLNRKAVEGCALMLACHRCISRSGIHTAAMLLGTVICKITSFYKAASRAYFDSCDSSSSGVMTPAGSTPASTSTGPASPASTSIGGRGGRGSFGGGMDDGTGLGGGFRVATNDSRWLQLEILAMELRKLEDVYARFREVCSDLSADPMQNVGSAMVGYLGQNLDDTLEAVASRRGDTGYS